LEFYHPLTPNLGLLLTKNDDNVNGEEIKLTSEEVEEYNKLIMKASHEQLFSARKELLLNMTTSDFA
jgi:hypothetical protein